MYLLPQCCSLPLRDLETRQPVRHFHSKQWTQSTDIFQQSSRLFQPEIFEAMTARRPVVSLWHLSEDGDSGTYSPAEVGASSCICKDRLKSGEIVFDKSSFSRGTFLSSRWRN